MGLFTNRKQEDNDLSGLSEAADMLAQFNDPGEEGVVELEASPGAPVPNFFPAEPMTDFSPLGPVDDVAVAPIAEIPAFTPFAALAAEDEAVATPLRRLEDRPRAQAGNVEIDASGLLELLGVNADSGLITISEAHQRFLADHQPAGADDADADGIKAKIRAEVNTAYASFRLTRAA